MIVGFRVLGHDSGIVVTIGERGKGGACIHVTGFDLEYLGLVWWENLVGTNALLSFNHAVYQGSFP